MKALLSLAFCLPSASGFACSSYAKYDESSKLTIVGSNWDLWAGKAMVLVLPSGLTKKSVVTPKVGAGKKKAEWVSKYSSIVLAPLGTAYPVRGINEHGLYYSIQAQFPQSEGTWESKTGALQTLNAVQLGGYLLDTASSVEDAIQRVKTLEFIPAYEEMEPFLHHLVCDETRCASFDFEKGRGLVVNGGFDEKANLPFTVFTNDLYRTDTDLLPRYSDWGGSLPIPFGGLSSPDRFVILASLLKKHFEKGVVPQTLEILESVSDSTLTRFQTLFDGKTFYFRDKLQAPLLKSLSLSLATQKKCNPKKGIEAQIGMLPLIPQKDYAGDAGTHLRPYRAADAFPIILESVVTPDQELPDWKKRVIARELSRIPKSYRCTSGF